MGVPIRFLLYAADETAANMAAQVAFERIAVIDGMMSDYNPESELMRLCRDAAATNDGPGPPTALSPELAFVLERSEQLARRSGGAFDVTVGPAVRLWRRARRQHRLPDAERLAEARAAIGFELLRLGRSTTDDSVTAQLLRPDMRLDLGGIAKGYAADEALRTLADHGIERALIDAGGDIVVSGPPPGETGWLIGVARLEPNGEPTHYMRLAHRAVATSGDAWQHVEIDGVRYSHIVDPRTGLGLTERSSVTVVAPDGTTADSLATAVSVLGPVEGVRLIEAVPDTAVLSVFVDDDKVLTAESSNFAALITATQEAK
ncbi:MAG: FAD:protein FMN transferase [Pirellulales bacterium]